MLKFFIIYALFFIEDVLTQDCKADDQYPWSYHGPNNGPANWVDSYPACGMKDQSPIDIMYKDIVNLYLARLNYNNFNTPITNATVQNVGWTVMVTPEDGVVRYILWGDDTYILDEIHFHFGFESDPGAENDIEGTKYPMEIHYVTHLEEDTNVIAVVGSLMKATDKHNSAFDPILEVLSNVTYRDSSADLQSDLNLAGLLPQDSGSYYFYVGSNAIPPCESNYIWWILKEVGKVGNDELDAFMTLYSVGQDDASDSCLMGPNYRPIQDLDGRKILSSQ